MLVEHEKNSDVDRKPQGSDLRTLFVSSPRLVLLLFFPIAIITNQKAHDFSISLPVQ